MYADDIQVIKFLKFLGYWDAFGYKKPIQFASAIRIELVRIFEQAEAQKDFLV